MIKQTEWSISSSFNVSKIFILKVSKLHHSTRQTSNTFIYFRKLIFRISKLLNFNFTHVQASYFKKIKHKTPSRTFIFQFSVFTFYILHIFCILCLSPSNGQLCNLTRPAQKNLIQCVSINVQLVVLLPDTKAAASRNVVQNRENSGSIFCNKSSTKVVVPRFGPLSCLTCCNVRLTPGVNKRGRLPSVWVCLAHEYVSWASWTTFGCVWAHVPVYIYIYIYMNSSINIYKK